MYRVALYQFRPRFGRVEENRRHALAAIEGVQADLVVLPELPFTGYLFRDRAELRSLAEDPRRSDTVDGLVAACRAGGFHVITGFAERVGDRLFNAALLIGPRGIVETYRKIHLFWNEKKIFDPGDRPFPVRRVRGARVGMMICWDWAFPEAARTLALRGAEIVAHPSNLVLDYCQRAMLIRGLENGVYVVTVNRFGEERRDEETALRFTGRSQVAGPRGERLFLAPKRKEVLHVERLDPARARDKRLTPRNDLLKDRRPEHYETA